MTIVAPPPTTTAQQQDSNTRAYVSLLVDDKKPAQRPDCGRWTPLVETAENAYASSSNGHRGQIVASTLHSLVTNHPDFAAMLSGKEYTQIPPALSLEKKEEQEEASGMPDLPESARMPEGLSRGACPTMERYIAHSTLASPEGFDEYHPDVFLWVLSTIAGRRVKIPFAQKEYTPLMVLLVADSSMYKKSTTARVGVNTLQAAGLRWLLGSDRTTPQKLLSDMAGQLPKNYGELDSDGKYRVERRLSMAAQRGWRYDEFGELIRALNKGGGIMDDLKGLLLQLDACEDQYEYSTQSRGTECIENPYLALIGCMTPPDIQESAKTGNKFWRDGFWARFIFCVPPEGTYKDCPFDLGEIPVPYEVWKPLKDWHYRLGEPTYSVTEKKDEKGRVTGYDGHKSVLPEVTCTFGDGVYDAWVKYRSALKMLAAKKEYRDFRASYDRLPTKAIRVAALIASLENNNIITLAIWALAQEIAERWRKSLHLLYEQVNANPVDEKSYAKRIEDEIERVVKKLEARDEPPTLRDLSRYLTRIDSGRIKTALVDMLKAKIICEEKTAHAVKYRMMPGEEDK